MQHVLAGNLPIKALRYTLPHFWRSKIKAKPKDFRMNSFFSLALAQVLFVLARGQTLVHTCYPNQTIVATNPNAATYTNVVAVQADDTDCTVTGTSYILITGCNLDQDITVHFSDRAAGSPDDIFGGDTVKSYTIHCDQIQDTGISRTVDDTLGATLVTSVMPDVTPDFTVTTDIRTGSATGTAVSSADVGDLLYWTIDVPGDYFAKPSCTAYSGTTVSATSKALYTDACSDDYDIGIDDFTSTTTVGLSKRYFGQIYAFKFYDNDDVFFKCSVLVCPGAGSANCKVASCTNKKRSVDENKYSDGSRYYEAGKVLHIVAGDNGARTASGGFAVILAVLYTILQ